MQIELSSLIDALVVGIALFSLILTIYINLIRGPKLRVDYRYPKIFWEVKSSLQILFMVSIDLIFINRNVCLNSLIKHSTAIQIEVFLL